MPAKVVLLPEIGKITFSQNTRSTRLKVSVRANQKVLVSYPPHVSFREAADFALQHSEWILQQQKKYTVGSALLKPGSPFKTRFHSLLLLPDGQKFFVRQKKFEITILYPADMQPDDPQVKEYVSHILTGIYRWEARRYLPGRLAELSELHGLPYHKVSIRNNRSNWGSCSSKNNISLNLMLMCLPDYLTDFILLHELAHTKIKNHSPAFWALLDTLSGGRAKELTREIRKFSPAIP